MFDPRDIFRDMFDGALAAVAVGVLAAASAPATCGHRVSDEPGRTGAARHGRPMLVASATSHDGNAASRSEIHTLGCAAARKVVTTALPRLGAMT